MGCVCPGHLVRKDDVTARASLLGTLHFLCLGVVATLLKKFSTVLLGIGIFQKRNKVGGRGDIWFFSDTFFWVLFKRCETL